MPIDRDNAVDISVRDPESLALPCETEALCGPFLRCVNALCCHSFRCFGDRVSGEFCRSQTGALASNVLGRVGDYLAYQYYCEGRQAGYGGDDQEPLKGGQAAVVAAPRQSPAERLLQRAGGTGGGFSHR